MNWNQLAKTHYDWIEQMGWHNSSVLEALGLIASEVGEAIEESFDEKLTEAFAFELADIVLRTADLAVRLGKDFEQVMDFSGMPVPKWRSHSTAEDLAELMVEVAKWINTARKSELDESFDAAMKRVMQGVTLIAEITEVDLHKTLELKIGKNLLRGSNGRVI